MPAREWVAATASALTLAFLLSLAAVTSVTAAVPPAVAGACVVLFAMWRPPASATATWLAAIPGAVSLTTTVLVLVRGDHLSTGEGMYGLLEVAFLAIILAAAVRWLNGPRLWVVTALTAAGQVAWILRFLPDRELGPLVASCALWSVPALVAVVAGGYPRLAAARLRNSVAHARDEQRKALERDVHDYVAHDLTGMIVQAQAARFAAADDPERLLDALRRIEESGQRAMTSMDRVLELWRSDSFEPELQHRPGLAELDRLVSDFRSAGRVAVDLSVVGDISVLPREVDQTLYRVCVEALTNVRRHAPAATRVGIQLTINGQTATLLVTDDGTAAPPARRTRVRGGTGLRNARGRVEALGGAFSAHAGSGGWRVSATLPF